MFKIPGWVYATGKLLRWVQDEGWSLVGGRWRIRVVMRRSLTTPFFCWGWMGVSYGRLDGSKLPDSRMWCPDRLIYRWLLLKPIRVLSANRMRKTMLLLRKKSSLSVSHKQGCQRPGTHLVDVMWIADGSTKADTVLLKVHRWNT